MRLDDLCKDPCLEALVMEHVSARQQPAQLLTRFIGVLADGTALLLEALAAKVALTRGVTIVDL